MIPNEAAASRRQKRPRSSHNFARLIRCCTLILASNISVSAFLSGPPPPSAWNGLSTIPRDNDSNKVLTRKQARLWVSSSNYNSKTNKKKPSKSKSRNSKNKLNSDDVDVDSLVAKMGLTPASSTSRTKKSDKTSNSQLRRPSLQTQLDYARNGHAVLRNLLDPSVLQTIRQELEQHASQNELLAWKQKVEVATGNHSPNLAHCETIDDCIRELERLGIAWDRLPFLQYFNTWRSLPSVKQLAYDLAETAAVLLDVPSVRLYQDAFFQKRFHDGPTPWHTDARMAPFDTSHILTLWIPLHDIPRDGSALHFVSKSHSDFALPFWNPYDDDDNNNDQSISPWNSLEERYQHHKIVHYMPLSLGDVTVHSGWTLHCADEQQDDVLVGTTKNQGEDRLALAISYVDARAPVREHVLSKQDHGDDEDQWSYSDWVRDFPSHRQPTSSSAVFQHPMVPVVWPQN